MIVGRLLGWLLLIAAAVLLGGEAVGWLADGAWTVKPLGQVWFEIDNGSLNLAQAVIQRYIHPAIWDPGIVAILQLPGWLVLGVLGLILLILFRRRAPRRKRWFAR